MPEVLSPDGVNSLINANEAAGLCDVSAATIRQWASRGYRGRDGKRQHLPVSGKDPVGRNLYRLIDVARAELATRELARR